MYAITAHARYGFQIFDGATVQKLLNTTIVRRICENLADFEVFFNYHYDLYVIQPTVCVSRTTRDLFRLWHLASLPKLPDSISVARRLILFQAMPQLV